MKFQIALEASIQLLWINFKYVSGLFWPGKHAKKLELFPRLNDEFGTVFEAIQIILEPVLDVKLRQR